MRYVMNGMTTMTVGRRLGLYGFRDDAELGHMGTMIRVSGDAIARNMDPSPSGIQEYE